MKPIWNDIDTFNINTERRSGAGFPEYREGGAEVVSLNGKWKFLYCPSVYDVPSEFYKAGANLKLFDDITVPSEWQIKGYGTPIYSNTAYPYAIESKRKFKIPYIHGDKNPTGIYVKEFTAEVKEGTNLYLLFGGINGGAGVYLNGRFVGFSADSFSETEYDVTDFVVSGINRLTVEVFQFTAASYLEDQDMWRLAGIFRDVSLVYKPKISIKDFFVRSKLSFDGEKPAALFQFDAEIESRRSPFHGGTLALKVEDREGRELLKKTYTAAPVEEGKSIKIKDYEIGGFLPRLWSHEDPYLYDVTFTLSEVVSDGNYAADIRVLDIRKHKFGFRSIEISDGIEPRILLNNKPLMICGVNRHDFHPEYGHAVPRDVAESDIKLLKANNITSLRTCHYPAARHLYELCDEYGILVMSECNLETHGLAKHVPRNSRKWLKHCNYRMENMVNSFKNHASVIFWSLGNESGNGRV
ncbi:MAG: hypothetical protein LBT20_04775, partial [Clostridiales bacterium]|nr:hypothetical protein [Clostridiales bacterium]